MIDTKRSFEKALEESNQQKLKEATAAMYQIYQELQKAGFDKAEAMTVMIAMTQNGKKEQNDD